MSLSKAWKWKVKVKLLSCVWLLATPWTAAHQAPLSMGFARQEYWSGVPLPSLMTTPSDLVFCCSNWYLHPFLFFLYFVAFLFSSCFLLASSDSAFPPGFLCLPSLLQMANSAHGNMGIFPKRLWLAQVVTIIPVWRGLPHQASGTLWVCTPAGCLGAPSWCPGAAGMRSRRQEKATLDGCTPMIAVSAEALRKMIPPQKRAVSSWHLACSVSTEEC